MNGEEFVAIKQTKIGKEHIDQTGGNSTLNTFCIWKQGN
jgi:hypothetical protein